MFSVYYICNRHSSRVSFGIDMKCLRKPINIDAARGKYLLALISISERVVPRRIELCVERLACVRRQRNIVLEPDRQIGLINRQYQGAEEWLVALTLEV